MLLFLLLSHLPSSPLPGVCWQLSKINFLMSSASGGAEALKWNDLVFFSCPRVFFRDPVTVLNLLSFLSELYMRCLSLHLGETGKPCSVSLDALFPARRASPGSYCPQLIIYRDGVAASPVLPCKQHRFAHVSGSCCYWKATWNTKRQLLITEILTAFDSVSAVGFLCTLHDSLSISVPLSLHRCGTCCCSFPLLWWKTASSLLGLTSHKMS